MINGSNTIYLNHEKNSLVKCIFSETIIIILNLSNFIVILIVGLGKSNLNKPKID